MNEPNLVATVNELREAAYDPRLVAIVQSLRDAGLDPWNAEGLDDLAVRMRRLIGLLHCAPKGSRGGFLLYLRTTILRGDSRDAEMACLVLRVFEPNIEKANALLLRGEM